MHCADCFHSSKNVVNSGGSSLSSELRSTTDAPQSIEAMGSFVKTRPWHAPLANYSHQSMGGESVNLFM